MTRDLGWARSEPACAVRELLLSTLFRPLIALYTRRSVTGREHLADLDGPVVFVANHSSHMDTPLLLRALPWRWRRRTAVAAAADYFYGSALLAHAVSLAFGTVPVERDGDAATGASELDLLLGHGWSVVVYAEGTRSRNGEVGKLRAGAAVLATERGLPIVPVYVSGTHATMPVGRSWMRRGPGSAPPAGPGRVRARDPRGARRAPDRRHGARAGVPRVPGRRTTTPRTRAAPTRTALGRLTRWRASSSPVAAASSAARCAPALRRGGRRGPRARPVAAGGGDVAARGAQPAEGHLLDEDALAAAMAGCAVAYHVAGVNTHCPNDLDTSCA